METVTNRTSFPPLLPIDQIQEEPVTKDRLLPKVTHVILETRTREEAAKSGVMGILSICFGPGDDDCISQIHLVPSGNRPSWRPPHVDLDGKKIPVFTGSLAKELGEWAQYSFDIIKKQLGKAQYDKRYRIAAGKAVEEPKVREAKGDPVGKG